MNPGGVIAHPSMDDISRTQNNDLSLRRQLASRHFYHLGKRIHFGGASFAVVIALVSPVVLLFKSDWGPMLGAIGGLWIFVSRIAFEPFRQDLQLKGATAQELFDCGVLDIPWNDALVRRLSDEEVRRASGSMAEVATVANWYPTDDAASWPKSVLICQRANAVWARRQHGAYRLTIEIVATAWAVFGVVVALVHQASLAEYLTTLALPSLPALLDATEVAKRHGQASHSRQLLEDQLDSLSQDDSADAVDLREIQDQLFVLRRDAPLVPEWFYKLIRPGFEVDMRYAAANQTSTNAQHYEKGGDDGADRK